MDTPTKNLPNQDSGCDITCQSPSSKHYHFKRQGYVGQPGLSALSQWHDTYTCKRKVAKVYLWNAIVTKHLALTIWHSNIYWNDNVYWMVIDKWCHNQNLGLEDFLWAYPSALKKINRKIIIKYMAHILITFGHISDDQGIIRSTQVNMHLHFIGPLMPWSGRRKMEENILNLSLKWIHTKRRKEATILIHQTAIIMTEIWENWPWTLTMPSLRHAVAEYSGCLSRGLWPLDGDDNDEPRRN